MHTTASRPNQEGFYSFPDSFNLLLSAPALRLHSWSPQRLKSVHIPFLSELICRDIIENIYQNLQAFADLGGGGKCLSRASALIDYPKTPGNTISHFVSGSKQTQKITKFKPCTMKTMSHSHTLLVRRNHTWNQGSVGDLQANYMTKVGGQNDVFPEVLAQLQSHGCS